MKLNEFVDEWLAKNVPVEDYQLEGFARMLLETFLYTTLELDPSADVESIK